jgi:hypothetical protein
MTVTPINPSLVDLLPTFSAFFAPEISRSLFNHSRAFSTEFSEADRASRALEREMGLILRSCAIKAMGTLEAFEREVLLLKDRAGREEDERAIVLEIELKNDMAVCDLSSRWRLFNLEHFE